MREQKVLTAQLAHQAAQPVLVDPLVFGADTFTYQRLEFLLQSIC